MVETDYIAFGLTSISIVGCTFSFLGMLATSRTLRLSQEANLEALHVVRQQVILNSRTHHNDDVTAKNIMLLGEIDTKILELEHKLNDI
nr:hypothetical protein BCU03_09490 [Vibrio breoganii]